MQRIRWRTVATLRAPNRSTTWFHIGTAIISNLYKWLTYGNRKLWICSICRRFHFFFATNQQFDIDALNNNLEKVHSWLGTNKLSLDIDEIKLMVMRVINKNVSHIPHYLTIQNTNIGCETSFNLLGVVIDEHLTLKCYTDKIANKISKNIGVLNQFKHYLPIQTLRTLYCSMIQTHLKYGNLAWGIECNRLNKFKKWTLGTICLSKYNDHTEGLFKERKLLTFFVLFLLNSLKFFYKYIHKTLPEYFS